MAQLQLLLALLVLVCGRALAQLEHVNGECYVDGVPTRCEPVRMSFSLYQEATASSTCGAPPAPFCVRSVSLGRVLSDCSGGDTCDASDPNNDHGVVYLTDFPLIHMSWWQSENNPTTDDRVVINIPLLTLAEISFISFDFHSIKAAAFHLERSKDYGLTYQPYHYFAISCEDTFGILPEVELTTVNETSVLCQTIQEPPTPGTITFFPAIDRPSANDSQPGYSEGLYQFVTATNIRVILDQHYEMQLGDEDPGYYYALEDINIIGSCQCYGHASQCVQSSMTGQYECVCQHNTTGTYCETCLDFYNDVPWRRADGARSFECKMCNCNNHSSECVFDEEVYAETQFTSGGVCINCDGNTAGQQCETCAPFYYSRPDREQTDPDVCQACQCNLEGVVDNGDCMKSPDGVRQPGNCYCKTNVMGKQCDMCITGYFNLSTNNPEGCQACSCSVNGSATQTCNHITGECECKPNVVGPQCDSCRENYYQPDPNEGCLPCDCNPGGSTSTQCDVVTGQCDCKPGVTGLKCNEVVPGNFFPAIDHLRLEAESAVLLPPSVLTLATGEGETFTGTGYYRAVEGEGIARFDRSVTFQQSGTYEVLFRYNLVGALVWETVTLTIRTDQGEDEAGAVDCGSGTELPVGDTNIHYTSWSMGTGVFISRTLCFRAGHSYTFILSEPNSGQSSSPTLDIDSMVIIPINIPGLALFDDSQLVADYMSCVDSWRRLSTISSAESICESITFTFSTAIYNGALECDCDPIGSLAGSVCEPFGGQCVCLPGVRGRTCDECRPGSFGFSSSGCTTCSCDPVGSVNGFCEPDAGTCDCLPNMAGPDCSTCLPNFWGLAEGSGCIPCSCNEIGSSSQQCDDVSGECECRPGVVGSQCDSCKDGSFGFSSEGCSQCTCNQAGSVEQDCDTVSGQCMCKENARTRDCSECDPGTFNLRDINPSGCQPCFCSGLGVMCSPAPGYTGTNVSTDFSQGTQGWSLLTDNLSPHPDPDSVIATLPFTSGLTILPNSPAFLQAPQHYLGNRLSSYLQSIAISLESQSSSAGAETITPFDVILSGNNIELGARFPSSIILGSETFSLLLHESFGWLHTDINVPATAGDLQTVLSSLNGLYITAGFNSSIILSRIHLDTVQESGLVSDPAAVTWVEQCDCPTGYAGLSCEVCSSGYTRSSSGSCEQCQCNGFSDSCDPDTGVCTGCTASTDGNFCGQCLPGTYGDPTQGVPCLPCPCPLTVTPGQFTDSCVLHSPATIICLNCPVGHTGIRCESCSVGYFGDPTGENGTPTGCSDCLCNGNIDSSRPNACDTTTGICLRCINNTAGSTCERCADGYFGDAIVAKNCIECDCDTTGSVDSSCDHQTGACMCLPNVAGERCERCSPGFYGFSSGTGCIACNCNPDGSEDSQCHPETGQCTCKPGVTGLLCDECATGFFGFSQDGCEACNCSTTNSVINTCDASGTCQCQVGSTGPNCETCIENFFQDLQGCSECPECYQELQTLFNHTLAVHDRIDSSLFNLLIEISPYDTRLQQQREDVREIADIGQIYAQQHSQLQGQVAHFTTLLNELRSEDVTELQANLDLLKTISTPVFIQALASEELMNRTISEFQMAQNEIARLVEFYIPNITQLLSAINNSHSLTTEALGSLTAQLQLLSTRASEMYLLVSELISVTNSSLTTAYEIQTLNEDIEGVANVLQQNVTYVQHRANSLTQLVRIISMDIMELMVSIREQNNSIPEIPSPSSIEELRASLSSSQSTAEHINTQLSIKAADIFHIEDTVAEKEREVGLLSDKLDEFGTQAEELEDQVKTTSNMTMAAVNAAERKIYQAVQVLGNLQNFSDNTFDVARRANEALGSVEGLTTDADAVLENVADIQQNVSELRLTLQDAIHNTYDAENITRDAQTVIDVLDAGTLLSMVSVSQNTSQDNLEEALELQQQVQHYQEQLMSLKNVVNRDEEAVQNSSRLVAESEGLLREANSSVQTLEAALTSLDFLQPSRLQQVVEYLNSQLSSLELELSAADIETLFSSLSQSLEEQKVVRQDLENSLISMEAELQDLRHVHSFLPLGCDSNL